MTQVRIQQSFLLNRRFELPTDGLDKVVEQYTKRWEKAGGDKIPAGLEQVTGLTYAHSILDAYIVNSSRHGNISNPLIIGGGFKPQEFVHVLTHELAHILADDNEQNYNWHEVAKKIYPKKDKMVAYHIMTHAMVEGLYTEVLKKPDWVIWLIKNPDVFDLTESHEEAWKTVDSKGYQAILAEFKKKSFVTDKKFA